MSGGIILSKDWAIMFSHKEYRDILKKYKDISIDFSQAIGKDMFCLIRHDVEFDIDRAEQIAKIDYEEGIKSSFLFQVRSNAYNVLSTKNTRIINNIRSYGHHIGLHLLIKDSVADNDWSTVYRELNLQRRVIEDVIDNKIDRFSFHRPKRWMLENREDFISGLINMYGRSFFEFGDSPKEIKYYADSRHRWSYGHPLDKSEHMKFQLLLHPDEWSERGYKIDKNFKKLILNNINSFKRTMFEETVYKNNDR